MTSVSEITRRILEDNLELCVSSRALRFVRAAGTPASCHTLLVCKSAAVASVAARRLVLNTVPENAPKKFSPDRCSVLVDHPIMRCGASIEVDLAAFLPNKHRCFQFLRSFLVDFATQSTLENDGTQLPRACILLNVHYYSSEDGIFSLVSLLGKNLFPFYAVLHVDSAAAVPPALLSRCLTMYANPSVDQVSRLAARLFPGVPEPGAVAARFCNDAQVLAGLKAMGVDGEAILGSSSVAQKELDAFAAAAATPLARKTSLESVAAKAAKLCKRATGGGAPRSWMAAAAVAKAAELGGDQVARDAVALFARADHQVALASNASFHAIVSLVRYWILMQIFQLTSKKTQKTPKNGRAKAAVGAGLLEHDP